MRARARLVMGVAALVAAGACGGASGGSPSSGPSTTASTPSMYAAMAESLCTAAGQADQRAAAWRTFFDGAHQPVHELAAQVAERDRSAAARLLEAKEAVESAFGAGDLAGAFDRLVAATTVALEVVDGPALGCDPTRTARP